mgnify:FL=1|jgi:hypothetical protein|nr:MAG TPA: hypothetical protein [Caudoviricetes sp.]
MKLTDNDYEELAEQIYEGGQIATIEGDEYLEVFYDYEEESYQEDDFRLGYGNGTGAWVTTAVCLCVNKWSCTDEDGKETDCDFDESKLQDYLTELRVG